MNSDTKKDKNTEKQTFINLNFQKQMRKSFQVKLEMQLNWNANEPYGVDVCIKMIHKDYKELMSEIMSQQVNEGGNNNSNSNVKWSLNKEVDHDIKE